MTAKLRALTLTQPWGTLVTLGAKRVETRGWPTPYRGPLAIHASAKFPDTERSLCFEHPFYKVLCHYGLAYKGADGTENLEIPTGSIVGVGYLSACVQTEDLLKLGVVGDLEREFGDFGHGRYGFLIEGIRFFVDPIPVRGMLGIWDVDPTTAEEVWRQAEGG